MKNRKHGSIHHETEKEEEDLRLCGRMQLKT